VDVLNFEAHGELLPVGRHLEWADLLAHNRLRCSPFNRDLTYLSHLSTHFDADFHLLVTKIELFSGLVVDVGYDGVPLSREVAHFGTNFELFGHLELPDWVNEHGSQHDSLLPAITKCLFDLWPANKTVAASAAISNNQVTYDRLYAVFGPARLPRLIGPTLVVIVTAALLVRVRFILDGSDRVV